MRLTVKETDVNALEPLEVNWFEISFVQLTNP